MVFERTKLGVAIAAIGAYLLATIAIAQVEAFEPVTDEMLRDPDPSDWLMWRRTYDSWGFSPLDQIDRDNVGQLQVAWSWAMEPGRQQTTPLVYNGIMYLVHAGDVVQALDATTGDKIWEYRRALPADFEDVADEVWGVGLRAVERTRNIAIYDDKIFLATADAHIVALNARTGALEWEVQTGDWRDDMGYSAGPLVADGKVFAGATCGYVDFGCFITAHDVETGEELWRRHTNAQPGEYGDETWVGVPAENRWHNSPWITGSYDPELNLVIWGTAVPLPSPEVLRGTEGGDLLFTNSTLALDADTGEIAWYFQHAPRDNWDLDHPFVRVLVDTTVAPNPEQVDWINPNVTPGEERRVVTGVPGKTGIYWTIDAETGEFLWAKETTYQNAYTDIDVETGYAFANEDLIPREIGETYYVCPGVNGGGHFPPGAYSPLTNVFYAPLQNACMNVEMYTDEPTPLDGYALDWVAAWPPDKDQVGRIDAVDVSTGETVWQHERRVSIGSLHTTAGGIVFGGDMNRRFFAFDQETGELLYEVPLGAPVSGQMISYAVDGKQYVAVPVGGAIHGFLATLYPEVDVPQGQNSLVVFTLPD